MALETGTYIPDLVTANPTDNDQESQGAAHLRLIKSSLRNQFPNLQDKPAYGSCDDLNTLTGLFAQIQALNGTWTGIKQWTDGTYDTPAARNAAITSALNSALPAYMPKAGGVFTGNVVAPTQATGDNQAYVATDAWVWNQLLNYGFVSTTNPYGAKTIYGALGNPFWLSWPTSGGQVYLQGGQASDASGGGGYLTVNFPTAFPSGPVLAVATPGYPGGAGYYATVVATLTNTYVTFYNQSGLANPSAYTHWLAIGW